MLIARFSLKTLMCLAAFFCLAPAGLFHQFGGVRGAGAQVAVGGENANQMIGHGEILPRSPAAAGALYHDEIASTMALQARLCGAGRC